MTFLDISSSGCACSVVNSCSTTGALADGSTLLTGAVTGTINSADLIGLALFDVLPSDGKMTSAFFLFIYKL